MTSSSSSSSSFAPSRVVPAPQSRLDLPGLKTLHSKFHPTIPVLAQPTIPRLSFLHTRNRMVNPPHLALSAQSKKEGRVEHPQQTPPPTLTHANTFSSLPRADSAPVSPVASGSAADHRSDPAFEALKKSVFRCASSLFRSFPLHIVSSPSFLGFVSPDPPSPSTKRRRRETQSRSHGQIREEGTKREADI